MIANMKMNDDLILYSGELHTDEKKVRSNSYFWERMESLFKIFRIMGYMPYKTDKVTSKLHISFRAVLWAAFSSLVQTIVMALGNKQEFETPQNFSSYTRVLYFTLRLINLNTTIFFPATWWEMPKIVRYVNNWLAFEENMKSLKGTPQNLLSPQTITKILFFFTSVTLAVIVLDQIFFLGYQPLLFFTYFFSVYTNMLYNLFWILNCIFIAQTASSLRRSLANVLITKPDPSIINSYRLLWIQLRDQVNEFAESIRFPFGIHLLLNHVALIFSTYTLTTSILFSDDAKESVHIIDLSIPHLWSIITLIAICESSHYVCQNIGQKFISKVLSEKSCLHDLSTMKEIDLLLETMHKNYPEIVIGGCLSVGRVLMVKTLSAEITYNIVLSQFDVDRH